MKDDPILVDIVGKRQGFLKYLLFHHTIEQKEVVWVLNFLKDHEVLEHFTFSNPPAEINEGITLTRSHQLLFHYKDRIITQADVIFHLLNQVEGNYYFYIAFNEPKFSELERYEKIRKLILNRQLPDDFRMLNAQDHSRLTEIISDKIEVALLLHDRTDFNYYSALINRLKE
ncbi:YpiB family protein [Macrococcus lamae]|nr:YpiB family protein [Macrococcus lamae]